MSSEIEQRLRERLDSMFGNNEEIRHRFFDGIAPDLHGDAVGLDTAQRTSSPLPRRASEPLARAPKSTSEQAELSTQVEYVEVNGKKARRHC